MSNKYNLIILFLISIAFIHSCIEAPPTTNYSIHCFNPNKGWKENDTIKLEIDLTDSLNTFSMYFMGEFKNNSTLSFNGYPINITYLSPNNEIFTDYIILPTSVTNKVKTFNNGKVCIEWPYRKNIKNNLLGKWKILITKANPQINYSNIISFGVTYKKE